ncbi:diguanylate cyclase domain-containing protein [Priestia megaterium]|uniref:sensor domain-containing diguanylate cyclase n=1 Tax=Priestia megaterium TaxID=1404 RepID=UPI001C8E73B3|nr:diguanylate cyclase [Priestia megaterium]MBY0199829.1 diguanylate cyclase [Priestia megaterium]MED3936770.1 diguanylate cyclase [Priestia megaterium]
MSFLLSLLPFSFLKKYRFPSGREVNEDKMFDKTNAEMLQQRVKLVSLALVVSYPIYIYIGFSLLQHAGTSQFRHTLISIHFTSFAISSLYLFFYYVSKRKERFANYLSTIVYGYIFYYVFAAALSTINSQLFTGRVDVYMMLLISTAVLCPMKLKHLCIIFIPNHLFLLYGLSRYVPDSFSLISKQINTTAAVAIALLISYILYTYRHKEYMNHLQLKESERNFFTLFKINPYPLLLTRLSDHKVLLINNKAIHFYNLASQDLDQIDGFIIYPTDEDREEILKRLQQEKYVKNYILEAREHGDSKWVMINYELLEYQSESCILAGITDITDLKAVEHELSLHASTDMLTGILNRRSGMEKLQLELLRAKTNDIPFLLCFIDINSLKLVNDQYGHREGDWVIKTIAESISGYISKDDTLFRYGGDEFLLMAPEQTEEYVQKLWQNINEQLENKKKEFNKAYALSASYGFIICAPSDDANLDTLIQKADAAMYKQKHTRVSSAFK